MANSETGGAAAATLASTGGLAAGGSQSDAAALDAADAGTDASSEPGLSGICSYADASPIPYDHTYVIAGEYAFEVAMSCDVGGFLAPLVAADPENLSEVGTYVDELTEWLRARILVCADSPADATPDGFLLVPSSQATGMSRADFRTLVALFFVVMDRHDGQPDGWTPDQKAEVKRRLDGWESTAVQVADDVLTRPWADPDCIPSTTDTATG